MALTPKRIKYRKIQTGRTKGKATSGTYVAFGEYGLQSLSPGRLNQKEIEAARVALTRSTRKGGKIWIRIFPDQPFTRKPAETRMGKGKGNPEGFEAKIKPGKIIFEVAGIPLELAKEAMRLASQKLSLKTKFAYRHH
ncbi:50S ribosomal protein L16 [PVC group bacterium]|nr:50S ribosomal protein L16 [PVC group bacterium]MCH7589824.1 50S ribosomal protein L16 [PVC group bacterium]